MFELLENKIVDKILKEAPPDWTEDWLNNQFLPSFSYYSFKTIQEIVPFFNDLAHYSHQNIATDDGSLPMIQIGNLVEEALDEIQNNVWDKLHKILTEKHGDPEE